MFQRLANFCAIRWDEKAMWMKYHVPTQKQQTKIENRRIGESENRRINSSKYHKAANTKEKRATNLEYYSKWSMPNNPLSHIAYCLLSKLKKKSEDKISEIFMYNSRTSKNPDAHLCIVMRSACQSDQVLRHDGQ